jgi:two-component system, NarL family, sensor histidine kinase BarA
MDFGSKGKAKCAMEARTSPGCCYKRPFPLQLMEMKVLLVDDDEKNLDLQSRIITRLGNTVDTEESGEAGVERVLGGAYDLVFFDCVLPGISGMEAISIIRQREKGRRTPIVALTGATEKIDYLSIGFDDYMAKPISIDEFRFIFAKWAAINAAKKSY